MEADGEHVYDSKIDEVQRKIRNLELEQGDGAMRDSPEKTQDSMDNKSTGDDQKDTLGTSSDTSRGLSPSPHHVRHKVRGVHERILEDESGMGRRFSDPGKFLVPGGRTRLGSDSSEEGDSQSSMPGGKKSRPRRSSVDIYEARAATRKQQAMEAVSAARRYMDVYPRSVLARPLSAPGSIGRTRRSNSLPMPDTSAIEIGEALGALATKTDTENIARLKLSPRRQRRVSGEDMCLEAIIEETPSQRAERVSRKQHQNRRQSTPNTACS